MPRPFLSAADLILRVKRQFGDESAVQIVDDDIIAWMNQGLIEIAQNNEHMQAIATATVTKGVDTLSEPQDMLLLRSMYIGQQQIQELSIEEWDNYIRVNSSGTETGQPSVYTRWASSLRVYPIPDKSYTVKIYYMAQPASIEASSDTIDLPVEMQNRLLEYVLQQAYELDENFEASNLKSQQFERGLMAQQNSQYYRRNVYPSILVRDEDAW